jgi:hypothetical protein
MIKMLDIRMQKGNNRRDNSPLYRFVDVNTAAGAGIIENLELGVFGKYSPFNFLLISNQTDVEFTARCGADFVKTIFDGTILAFDEELLPAFKNIRVINESGGAATGTIEVTVQKVKSYRQIIKERL